MFIKNCTSGYREPDGSQYAHGWFLVIAADPTVPSSQSTPELRAFVRYCRMEQLGCWMMGDVAFEGFSLCVSGTYGNDGLPMRLSYHFPEPPPDGKRKSVDFTPDELKVLWDKMVPMPAALQAEFWAGGGHNSAGPEGPSMNKWAEENFNLLRQGTAVTAPKKRK